MSMQGEMAQESMAEGLCEFLKQQLEAHPEAAQVLKEVGREVLDYLLATPEWAREYQERFRE